MLNVSFSFRLSWGRKMFTEIGKGESLDSVENFWYYDGT